MDESRKRLRAVPAVEKVLQAIGACELPRPVVVATVRQELEGLRQEKSIPEFDMVIARIQEALDRVRRSRIQRVINGTGIVVHTNLGRSPLGPAVVETLRVAASRYNNLEFDISTGERGGRAAYLEEALALLCRSAAATVVNNCAAALVLVLRHFAVPPKHEVIISRGELVQIGGGFRIPEILEASGTRLREIGTTNKTSIKDYAKAISKSTALILKVHRSNFFMSGFVDSPSTEELAALAHKHRVPFVEDLGSGAVVATDEISSLEHEPTPGEILKRGVDLVCFSGDKLLGGPQAGIIAGKARFISALKKEPFFRALRCDKLILSALQTTVENYLAESEQPPILEMIRTPVEVLRERAEAIVQQLSALPAKCTIGECESQIGGGTLPRSAIPSIAIQIVPEGLRLPEFAERLRRATPPVIGAISGGKFKLDLRTVFPDEDQEVIAAIRSASRRDSLTLNAGVE
jgi:L-seryl-tRNA(Ser) seleniumtransferase